MTDLNTALAIATAEATRIGDLMKSEIEAATAAIKAKYRDAYDAATTAKYNAAQAVEDAKLAAAQANPLVGKKMTKIVNKKVGGSAWNPRYKEVAIFGIVEVCDYDTSFPQNIGNWRRPDRGTAFIRLLRADGKPGLAFEDTFHGWTEVK